MSEETCKTCDFCNGQGLVNSVLGGTAGCPKCKGLGTFAKTENHPLIGALTPVALKLTDKINYDLLVERIEKLENSLLLHQAHDNYHGDKVMLERIEKLESRDHRHEEFICNLDKRIDKLESEELDKHSIRLGALEKEVFLSHEKRIELLEKWREMRDNTIGIMDQTYNEAVESCERRIQNLENTNRNTVDMIMAAHKQIFERIQKLESYPLESGSIVFTEIVKRIEKLETNWMDLFEKTHEYNRSIDGRIQALEKSTSIKSDADSLRDLIIHETSRIDQICKLFINYINITK